MAPLTKRAQIWVDLCGGKQNVLSEIAGVTPTSVNDWLSGKTQSLRAKPAARIATHFGQNLIWVSEGIGRMQAEGTSPPRSFDQEPTHRTDVPGELDQDVLLVDRLDVKAKGGGGLAPPEHEQVVGQMRLLKSWLARMVFNLRGPLKIIEAYERSMEPTIHQGDLMLVDTGATTPDISGIYILIRMNSGGDEEIMVKRLRRVPLGEGIEIVSDNKVVGGDPVLVEGSKLNDLMVKGRVVYVWHGEKM